MGGRQGRGNGRGRGSRGVSPKHKNPTPLMPTEMNEVKLQALIHSAKPMSVIGLLNPERTIITIFMKRHSIPGNRVSSITLSIITPNGSRTSSKRES
jgi:hypothetical protein